MKNVLNVEANLISILAFALIVKTPTIPVIDFKQVKYKAVEYIEGDMNNHHIVIVTVKNYALGTIKFIVPYNSQIANRVKYYVDNGIRDFFGRWFNSRIFNQY